jgi:hypothetical protein
MGTTPHPDQCVMDILFGGNHSYLVGFCCSRQDFASLDKFKIFIDKLKQHHHVVQHYS